MARVFFFLSSFYEERKIKFYSILFDLVTLYGISTIVYIFPTPPYKHDALQDQFLFKQSFTDLNLEFFF